MADMDQDALVRMMDIVKAFCVELVDELKDVSTLSDSIRDLLPALIGSIEDASERYVTNGYIPPGSHSV